MYLCLLILSWSLHTKKRSTKRVGVRTIFTSKWILFTKYSLNSEYEYYSLDIFSFSSYSWVLGFCLLGKIKIFVGLSTWACPQLARIVGPFWHAWHAHKARIERALPMLRGAPAGSKIVGAHTPTKSVSLLLTQSWFWNYHSINIMI